MRLACGHEAHVNSEPASFLNPDYEPPDIAMGPDPFGGPGAPLIPYPSPYRPEERVVPKNISGVRTRIFITVRLDASTGDLKAAYEHAASALAKWIGAKQGGWRTRRSVPSLEAEVVAAGNVATAAIEAEIARIGPVPAHELGIDDAPRELFNSGFQRNWRDHTVLYSASLSFPSLVDVNSDLKCTAVPSNSRIWAPYHRKDFYWNNGVLWSPRFELPDSGHGETWAARRNPLSDRTPRRSGWRQDNLPDWQESGS